ncbi:hypothetical protein ACFTWF_38565 [Rhodococcus sp. NPDC056960]|uniref:hypothetical protein n=1 Tax=Rhodococcus sp. NPDC056960 TaxID=3345982 RepID=UPI00363CFE41
MTTILPEQHPYRSSGGTREIIGFALRWAPFDSGDEYILPQFGITPATFYRRLAEILRDGHTRLDHGVRETLTGLCRNRPSDAPFSDQVSTR